VNEEKLIGARGKTMKIFNFRDSLFLSRKEAAVHYFC
jgi:hypothetical protein